MNRFQDLGYEVSGDGEAVVLVHGIGGSRCVWDPLIAAFRGRYTTITVEIGRYATAETSPITVPGVAQSIEALLRELGHESFHLIGHSLGATICQHVVGRCAGQVKSLVLIGGTLPPKESAKAMVASRAAKARTEGMDEIAAMAPQMAISENTRLNKPSVAAFLRELILRQHPEGYAQTCEAAASRPEVDISFFAKPVLLITGHEDKTSPPSDTYAIAKTFENAEVRLLDRCGHWHPIERPAEVNKIVINFLFRQ